MNEKLREALEDFEGELDGWAAAYPLTIFREPSDEELKNANEALKTVGLTLDVLSASAMRYVATSLAAHFLPVREALAASKQEPVGINGLTYYEESETASVMGIVNRKQEQQSTKPKPQAQAEPVTAGWMRIYMGMFGGFRKNPDAKFDDGDYAIITLQSHREAMAKAELKFDLACQYIAKKDAALVVCEEALEIADKFCDSHSADECPDTVALPIKAAITQAKEART